MTTTKLPRVLMFCGLSWPRIGGAERQALRLSNSLLARGCRVEVLTPQLEAAWALEENIEGIQVHRFPFVDLTKRIRNLRGLGSAEYVGHGLASPTSRYEIHWPL